MRRDGAQAADRLHAQVAAAGQGVALAGRRRSRTARSRRCSTTRASTDPAAVRAGRVLPRARSPTRPSPARDEHGAPGRRRPGRAALPVAVRRRWPTCSTRYPNADRDRLAPGGAREHGPVERHQGPPLRGPRRHALDPPGQPRRVGQPRHRLPRHPRCRSRKTSSQHLRRPRPLRPAVPLGLDSADRSPAPNRPAATHRPRGAIDRIANLSRARRSTVADGTGCLQMHDAGGSPMDIDDVIDAARRAHSTACSAATQVRRARRQPGSIAGTQCDRGAIVADAARCSPGRDVADDGPAAERSAAVLDVPGDRRCRTSRQRAQSGASRASDCVRSTSRVVRSSADRRRARSATVHTTTAPARRAHRPSSTASPSPSPVRALFDLAPRVHPDCACARLVDTAWRDAPRHRRGCSTRRWPTTPSSGRPGIQRHAAS